MEADALARLRRNLAAASDDALVALASRGLVRRAAKDLERAGSLAVELAADAVLVRGDGWTVAMPPGGPAAATDDTPATGVTRQIIAATMYLRDHWDRGATAGVDEQPLPDDEADQAAVEAVEAAAELLLDASTADLVKWSGKTPLLEAAAALHTVGEATVSRLPQLTVAFSKPHVRVVLMTDRPAKSLRRLLDQFKTTVASDEHARWVLLAVLAMKRGAGRDTFVENDLAAELSDVVREDRRRVSRRTRGLLRAIAATGTAHPSTRIVERLRTAGVAAEAARFPRLARLLSSIADDARLQIDRSAAADPPRMMQRIVVAHALSEAAARPENAERAELFGRPRTRYTLVGDLQLRGLGAYGWRTASGFEGLTAIFWDAAGRRFLTASISRGEGQDPMFSIPQAYHLGIGWSGGAAVSTICRSQLTLRDARINADGRLSTSETCRAEVGEPTDPEAVEFGERAVRSWSDLSEIARQSQPLGLRLPDPRAANVVVQPQQWGQRWFDELEQAMVWQLHDESGAALEVRVPWTEVDEDSVAFLESLKVDRDRPTALLGRLELDGGRPRIYPFGVFSRGTARGDKVLCPQFDQDRVRSRNEALMRRLRKKFRRPQVVQTRVGDELTDLLPEATDDLINVPPLLRQLVADTDNILTAALESGAGAVSPAARETLARCRDQLESLAVAPLAEALTEILADDGPRPVLRAAYRLQLLRQALQLSRL